MGTDKRCVKGCPKMGVAKEFGRVLIKMGILVEIYNTDE